MTFEIQDLNENNMDVYLSCGCSPQDSRITDKIRAAQQIKRKWAEDTFAKGLGAKIAFDDGYPAGFAEFLPIKVAPAPVQGEGLLFISDIHVNDDDDGGKIDYQGKGLGRALVQSIETHAREHGSKGLATLALDGPWMPAAFYERLGFAIVDRVGPMRLLWKPFSESAPPQLRKGNFKPTVGENVVHIDLIYSSQCWGMVLQAQTWRRIAAEHPGRVVVHEHLADDRRVMSLDCMTGSIGVYVDGVRGPGHPIDEPGMRELLQVALDKRESR